MLLPFSVRRYARAQLILADAEGLFSEREILERYAFGIDTTGAGGAFSADEKLFHAERYGGKGLRTNGGGVRCGVDGDWLVKGVGCNQLLGENMNFWSAHGSLSLADAIGEALWAKLLQRALPFGAVRIPAVIATGAASWVRGPQGEKLATKGALLLRQATHRLGSFERAVYFRPDATAAPIALSDADRVRRAIAELPRLLPRPPALGQHAWADMDLSERLCAGLLEMARRFAAQLAAAAAKRIMHGAMVSSNIALDGRWLDLGSVTGLPRYGISRVFKTSFWNEYVRLMAGIKDVVFYIKKYTDPALLTRPQLLSGLEMSVKVFFYQELGFRLQLRAGFPEQALRKLSCHPAVAALGKLFVALAQAGTSVDVPAGPADPNAIGDYDFGAIAKILAGGADRACCEPRLRGAIGDPRLRRQVLEQYVEVAEMLRREAAGHGVDKLNFSRLCALNAMKSATDMHFFSRSALNAHVRAVIEREADERQLRQEFEALAAHLGDQADMVLADTAGYRCVVWRDGRLTVEFDAVRGRWLSVVGGARVARDWDAILGDACADFPAPAMRRYWGDDFLWSMP
ncbi:hypothetical protein ACFOLJ_13070 [Rugamonas sp. CCM 8940]|uniref:hypothetical protein n=1 Tax=Rugamonas sp. CCM 8940 TaxID=2765359 RepID=UPI0018F5016D|nr:hypothetical protein [Rugamonas sp. CCM 8940]MBJ7308925.1 hypothetical protein [Rugamonas sp. CCM 8940]